VETNKKDGRSRGDRHSQGARAWEGDALNANVLRTMVEDAMRRDSNGDAWELSCLIERADTDARQHLLDRWTSQG
jgi:hypothetical protein